METIYLDHNATTKVREEVLQAMLPYFRENFANPSSLHCLGVAARKAVEESRSKVATLLGADSSEIIFTSGGTESNNLAIRGVAYKLKDKGNHIITSKIEHLAVLSPCEQLQKEGFKVSFISVDEDGVVDLEELKRTITDKTTLITIMHANNETGTTEPIEEIARLTKERGVLFHTDAVQSFGKLPIDVRKIEADLLSISGHKIYGPKGVGALYIKKGAKLEPLIRGGHHEKNLRAGTENVPGIVGLGEVARVAGIEMEQVSKRLMSLRDRLHNGIIKSIDSVKLNGHPTLRLPNTLNISFKFIEGESIILNLDAKGVAVSSGSACTSGSLEPSHVLMAMGVDPATAQGSIRFSLGRENTEEEIDCVLEILPEIVQRLRKMSPLYEGKG